MNVRGDWQTHETRPGPVTSRKSQVNYLLEVTHHEATEN